MTINRNLSILAEGASSSGVLGASNGGTGLTAPGASGNVLTSNGSAWTSVAPSGGGSAMTLISTQTASASTAIEWTGLSGYDKYFMIYENIYPISDTGDSLYAVIGYGTTPTYSTSSYTVSFIDAKSPTTLTSQGYDGYNSIILQVNGLTSNTAYPGASGYSNITGASSGQVSFQYITFSNYNGTIYQDVGVAYNNIGQTLTAIKLLLGNGSVTFNGSASLYGISS
jgi:hypothetical protein